MVLVAVAVVVAIAVTIAVAVTAAVAFTVAIAVASLRKVRLLSQTPLPYPSRSTGKSGLDSFCLVLWDAAHCRCMPKHLENGKWVSGPLNSRAP